ncbi:hypothetical protein [Halopiger xanaduensis]|uniref:Uncharacterized protein n=1 Tax=Halopiger xanaduensis (strain DSM 18323 / JCM 14033 / SH-6) TaxID=797210 RepID=F8DE03_HALXS|nr:hypothetical protein [Halopiger xanaduensis]AEH39038.1 hypothetical protein Halxa_0437 [Halopiger xanaduensis SH-6]
MKTTAEDAIVHRLNLIIVLLLVVIAILVWPIVPRLLFFATVASFVCVAAALFWGITRAYR